MKQFFYSMLIIPLIIFGSFAMSSLGFSGLNNISKPDSEIIKPSRTEIISPLRNETFNKKGTCPERRQGGNPREIDGYL